MADQEFGQNTSAEPMKNTDREGDPREYPHNSLGEYPKIKYTNGDPGQCDCSHVYDLISSLDLHPVHDCLRIVLCQIYHVVPATCDLHHYWNKLGLSQGKSSGLRDEQRLTNITNADRQRGEICHWVNSPNFPIVLFGERKSRNIEEDIYHGDDHQH